MATITYGDGKVKVVIGTMSWAQALNLARSFIGFVEQSTDEPSTVVNTIGAYFAMYSPHKIYLDDQLIEAGSSTFRVGDETFTITLPLTMAGFMALPGPLVGDWIEAATEQNEWLLKRLDFMVSRITLLTSVPPPGSGQSSEPTKADAPMKTTG